MDKLVTDIGLVLYEYLKDCQVKPDADNFNNFINAQQCLDFLTKQFNGKNVIEPRDVIGSHVDTEPKSFQNVGISALQIFVSYNWHGYQKQPSEELTQQLKNLFPEPQKYLELPEETYPNVSNLEHLCLAKYLLTASHTDQEEKTNAQLIWELRYLIVHQMIVETPLIKFYKQIKRNIASLKHYLDVPSELRERLLRTQLSVEISTIVLWYREVGSSKLFLDNALKFTGLEIELSGALGVRTKFQTNITSQLVLKVDRKNEEKQLLTKKLETTKLVNFPKNVCLDDDTLYDQVKFSKDSKETEAKPDALELFPEEETLVLAVAAHVRRATGSGDELIEEELETYVQYLLKTSSNFNVRFKALLMRSMLERSARRKVERAMMQLEHLTEIVRNNQQQSDQEPQNKLELFYATLNDPHWMVERRLAEILMSLGCTKSALDIYERQRDWKNQIVCLKRLERKHHAENLIRGQLSKKETPHLLCLLGDVTGDIELYKKSFELSGEKCFQAMTSLGDFNFERKAYEECREFYQLSLKLNSLQVSAWQRLAYASLHVEDYKEAARAYRRYLEFEPDSYEAWNNLSKAYVKLGSKDRAYHTLVEALRWNYEQHRLWENLLLVAVDIGAFEHCCQAWHRLIDLKGNYEDDQVVEILVNAVINDTLDFNGNGSARLMKKMLMLLARATGAGYSSAKLWFSYAKLVKHDHDLDATKSDQLRAIDFIKRSNRASIQKPTWPKDVKTNQAVLEHCINSLSFYQTELATKLAEDKRKKEDAVLRLALNNIAITAETSINQWDVTRDDVNQVKSILNQFKELIAKLN